MGGNEQRDQRLFSYGTLRQENVQLTLFGRRLGASRISLPATRFPPSRSRILKLSDRAGLETHPIRVAAGNPALEVAGTVFLLSAAELEAADDYECRLRPGRGAAPFGRRRLGSMDGLEGEGRAWHALVTELIRRGALYHRDRTAIRSATRA